MKKLNKKIIFLPFYLQCPQHRFSASARFRAEWPAKYLKADLADEMTSIGELINYDLVIFQKCFNVRFLATIQYIKNNNKETKIAFDLCDAEWLTREQEIKDMIEAVDFITVPTEELKKWVNDNFPEKNCYVIPDGHDLDYYFSDPSEAEIDENTEMRYVWYGNSGTIKSLEAIMPILEEWRGSKDTLTIIADERAREAIFSDKIEIKFVPWKLETINQEVKKCNLVLNPKLSNSEEYRYKSNNKTAMAYILGLPCIDRQTSDEEGWENDLIEMRVGKKRRENVEAKKPYYLSDYKMEKVVKIWEKALYKEL